MSELRQESGRGNDLIMSVVSLFSHGHTPITISIIEGIIGSYICQASTAVAVLLNSDSTL